MAVSKKGRRKVNYKGKQYLWSIQESKEDIPDSGGFVEIRTERYLTIVSSSKKFIVRYRMPKEKDEFTELRVIGQEFPRQPGAKVLRFPRWRHDSKRYPTGDFVRRIIEWCLTPEKR